jgi:hypothetical protein
LGSSKVALVLRSGGEFKLEHVERLVRQIRNPGNWHGEIVVLSDMPIDLPGVCWAPLQYRFPGWWAKMELFTLGVDVLYFDLDTTIVGDINELAGLNVWAPNADFYKPEKLQTSMGFFTAAGAERTWSAFSGSPDFVMRSFRGDGEFVNHVWAGKCRPVQDLLPGQVVSYKINVQRDPRKAKHVGTGYVPEGARVVCFHGQPRPWAAPELRFK